MSSCPVARALEAGVEFYDALEEEFFSLEDDKLLLKWFTVQNLPESVRDWTFDLVKRNMEAMYRQAKCGWSDEEKWEEMFDDETNRFLVVFDQLNNAPVGFIMLQFCYEEDANEEEVAVVYCMEIQIEKEWRGKRIGQFLMSQLEKVGKKWNMTKSMLTVFITNQPAYRFYIQLGYKPDEVSPSQILSRSEAQKYDYEIMSKYLG
ncbi:acyl-CoA N-acyltransferase [Basidiobolus meristosporus CBS 931.73]|uniref:N-alpha-acetyltransferase 40 n=1 Tax=Basidiobolus meristosporus CBS 931.73 TaxID=1314790 RepID=A0A1Y1YQF1_9FUNG|nr:acyl-CoA N-acyltransferase [Basidiobolus meristosporus CBS 931.73]|eukprot:ORY00044.1 acyl-CoA N-acyltransferase [Basidiobolus meristosporus CBS 931.73]